MKLNQYLSAAITCTTIFASNAFAEQIEDRRISQLTQYFTECHQAGKCNGSFLIAERGKVLFHQAMGANDHKVDSRLTIQSQFDIGSLTKQFTAMAIMILKKQGKLNFDHDITKYLPELSYRGMTIRHLLTHTSGLPNYMNYYTSLYRRGEVKADITNSAMVSVLAKEKIPAVFSPGQQWQYSNTGYVLLAEIISRVSNMSYDKFLHTHIFSPLKMDNTVLRSTALENQLDKRVYGFKSQLDNNRRAYDQIPFFEIYGDGGIYSTTEDMFKWDQAYYSETLVSIDLWSEATSPTVLLNGSIKEYGFGLALKPSIYGKKKISHGGHWRGFRTEFVRQIEDQHSIILLTNNGIDDSLEESVKAIEAILANDNYEPVQMPISKVLYPIFEEKGIKAGISFYQKAKVQQIAHYDFSEEELNSLGYFLLANNYTAEAVAVFKLNKDAYANSQNVYDSLSEGLIEANQQAEAIEVLTQALILFPEFKEAKERLVKLNAAESS